jgi:hypothetical protein
VNFGIGSHVHRPKLQKCKWDLKLTETLLPEKDRALGGKFDKNGQNGKHWREKEQSEGTAGDIDNTL